MLTEEEKRELLVVARDAITNTLRQKPVLHRASTFPGLQQKRGVFVTLRIDHDLRGCIGYIEPLRPLGEVVSEVAVKAATEDPRFSPLTLFELDRTTIEISVLSPLHEISSVEEIEVGTHGLVLELGGMRGLLLPQVATEYHWKREMFLEAVSRKAGLPPDAWQNPEVRMYVFTAEVVQPTPPKPERGEEADVLM